MSFTENSSSLFYYFCIGVTVTVLTPWLLDRQVDIRHAVFVGAALAAGRLARLLTSDRKFVEAPGISHNG